MQPTTLSPTPGVLKAAATAALALSVGAGTAQADIRTLDDIVVSATRTERSAERSPIATEVITERDLQALGAATLRDALRQTPGVLTTPGRGDISIRGAGANGTLLLVDGRRLAGEVGQGFELDRISVARIERIEIVKGPMGVLYGSDALGGIINIITKSPQDGLEGQLEGSVGGSEASRYRLQGDLRGRQGDTGFSGWFSALKQEAWREARTARPQVPLQGPPVPPSAHPSPQLQQLPDSQPVGVSLREPTELINLGGRLEQQLAPAFRLGADLDYTHERRSGDFIAMMHPSNVSGPRGSLPVRNAPVNNDWENDRWNLGIDARWQPREALQIDWRSYRTYYEKDETITTPLWREMGYASQADSASVSGTGKVTIDSHELTATLGEGAHRTLVGSEYREEERDTPFFNPENIPETATNRYLAGFMQHEWALSERVDLLGGLRHDRASNASNATSVNLGGQYRASEALNLRLNFAQGFRSPDSPELFLNRETPAGRLVGANVADAALGKQAASLDPETSDNIELGLSGRGDGWDYDLALFQTRISDRIERVNRGDFTTFDNTSRARINGLEAAVGYRLAQPLRAGLSWTLLDSKNRETGERLTLAPRHAGELSLNWTPDHAWQIDASVRRVGSQVVSAGAERADGYTLSDLRITYLPPTLGNTELFGGVDNLFNASIDDQLGSEPGRHAFVGVRQFF